MCETGSSRRTVVLFANAESPHLQTWDRTLRGLAATTYTINTHSGQGPVRFGIGLVRQLAAARSQLKLAARRGEEVAFQAHGAGRSAVIATMLGARPLTVVVHGSEVLRRSDAHPVVRRLLAFVLEKCDRIVVTAAATAFEIGEWLDLEVATIHPGVEWDLFRFQLADKLVAKDVLSIRRIMSHYRIHELIEAVVGLESCDGLPLRTTLLLGDASSESAYVATAEDLINEHGDSGDVRILNEFLARPALAALMNQHRVAVSLAVSDQMSTTILEALAAGCVVVLSDLEAYRPIKLLPQVILVKDPTDVVMISGAIRQAIAGFCHDADSRQRRSREAEEVFCGQFPAADDRFLVFSRRAGGALGWLLPEWD